MKYLTILTFSYHPRIEEENLRTLAEIFVCISPSVDMWTKHVELLMEESLKRLGYMLGKIQGREQT